MSEKEILQKMHEMCQQSLYPELYEQWEKVKEELENRRKDLQK